MKLCLVVLSEGKAKGHNILITLPQFLIGRDAQCQLRPASPMISKRHCAVLVKGGKAFVRDFGSTNGTFVNEEPVKGERELHNEDTLKVGPLLFRVAFEAAPSVTKPTPTPTPATAKAKANAEAVAKAGSDDDSIAAMLLSLQDDGASPAPSEVDKDGVPGGTTVHMISPLADTSSDQPAQGEDADKAKSPEKKEPPKKSGNTSQAAAAILEKYTRRQRS